MQGSLQKDFKHHSYVFLGIYNFQCHAMVFYDQDHTCLTEADNKLQTKFGNVFANSNLRITIFDITVIYLKPCPSRMDGRCITRADYLKHRNKTGWQ